MQFPGVEIATTDDKRIRIRVHSIDDTELIYEDDEARDVLKSKHLLSEEELNQPIIQKPHPTAWGRNVHIHCRLIVDDICRAYLQLHPDAVNRDTIEQLPQRLVNNEIDAPKVDDISHICAGEECFLTTWEETEQFVYWVKNRSPF